MNTNAQKSNNILLDIAKLSQALDMDFVDAVFHAAICYIESGIPVLPLLPNAKQLPDAETGINYTSATLKRSTVEKWFGKNGKFVGHNIGVACGHDGGVMALDVDSKAVIGTRTTGIKELEKIIEKHGGLPPGPKQLTPSGGMHYLYLWQENATSSNSKVAPGIDTRGGMKDKYTGHIVVFPSIINGSQYIWEFGGEVPAMPEWLIASLGKRWDSAKAKEKPAKLDVPIDQISRMLNSISPDDVSYEDWVKIGMALKTVCGEDGLEVWDEWSKDGVRRREGECRIRWKTFDEDGDVGFGTLSFLAREAGWRPLPGDVTSGSDINAEIEERILHMNDRYSIIRSGKNLLIATFDKNPDGVKVGFLAPGSFSMLSANETIIINNRRRQMSEIWLSSPQRREYYDMGIYPNNDQPEKTLNLWNGWGVSPNADTSCEHYLRHTRDIICSGDLDLYEWILDWMADCVQDSRNIKGSCIVLRGIEGCGKGIWANNFGKLFGKHYTHLVDAERLTARFNSMLTDSVVVFADEILFPGDRKTANILKGLVTEPTVVRESKGVDSIETDNLMHLIISSNEDWIVPAGPQSRRWLVMEVNGTMANNKEYFSKIANEMDNGGREALLYLLMNRKVTKNLRLAPKTKALIEQRRMSNRHDSMTHFFNEALEKGGFETIDVNAQVGDSGGWPSAINRFALFNEYRVWAKETRVSNYDILTMTTFTSKLGEYKFQNNNKNVIVPNQEDLLSAIKEKLGENYD
jgi:hypothetical protein